MGKKLSECQRKLVENNHNLIYSFAHTNNISVSDYYDILAIGLCKAALIYDENKGKFTTIAYACMKTEIMNHWKYMNKKSNIPENNMVYYDELLDNDKYFFKNDVDNFTINDIMYPMFLNELCEDERLIIEMLINGMTHKEMAKELSCSRQTIEYRIKKIRKKVSGIIY